MSDKELLNFFHQELLSNSQDGNRLAPYCMGLKNNWRNVVKVQGTPLPYPSGITGVILCDTCILVKKKIFPFYSSNSLNFNKRKAQ